MIIDESPLSQSSHNRPKRSSSRFQAFINKYIEWEDDGQIIEDTDFELFNSPIHGLGVRSLINIGADRKVIEYKGELINHKEKKKRKKEIASGGCSEFYFFELEKNKLYIDATGPKSNLARYINHSCSPNCVSKKEGQSIFYYSINCINKNEELTVDYGGDFFTKKIRCNCNTAACRYPPINKVKIKKKAKKDNNKQVFICFVFYMFFKFFNYLVIGCR